MKRRRERWAPDADVYGESYVLNDIGSHAMDVAQHLLRKPLVFKEAVIRYDEKIRVCSDIAATVQLYSDDGIPVAITVSKAVNGISNQLKIRFVGEYGEVGTEHVLDERIFLVQGHHKQWINRTPDLEFDVLQFPEEHLEGWLSGFLNLFNVFYRQLAGEKTAVPFPAVGESLQRAQLIRQILQKGHWEPIAI